MDNKNNKLLIGLLVLPIVFIMSLFLFTTPWFCSGSDAVGCLSTENILFGLAVNFIPGVLFLMLIAFLISKKYDYKIKLFYIAYLIVCVAISYFALRFGLLFEKM